MRSWHCRKLEKEYENICKQAIDIAANFCNKNNIKTIDVIPIQPEVHRRKFERILKEINNSYAPTKSDTFNKFYDFIPKEKIEFENYNFKEKEKSNDAISQEFDVPILIKEFNKNKNVTKENDVLQISNINRDDDSR